LTSAAAYSCPQERGRVEVTPVRRGRMEGMPLPHQTACAPGSSGSSCLPAVAALSGRRENPPAENRFRALGHIRPKAAVCGFIHDAVHFGPGRFPAGIGDREVAMRRMQLAPIAQALFLCSLVLVLAGLACNMEGKKTPPVLATRAPGIPVATPPPEQPAGALPALATKPPGQPAGETKPYSREFLETDCSCLGYESSDVRPWGNSDLTCRYDWSGPNIDGNTLAFEVSHYYHTDQLLPDFKQRVEGLTSSYGNSKGDNWQAEELRNDDEGYVFLSYGPGGGGKQGEIPLCGGGRGVFQVAGEFLIETEMNVCDVPYSKQVYVNILADMETCARAAIERIK
jgi:hypothetical protein